MENDKTPEKGLLETVINWKIVILIFSVIFLASLLSAMVVKLFSNKKTKELNDKISELEKQVSEKETKLVAATKEIKKLTQEDPKKIEENN